MNTEVDVVVIKPKRGRRSKKEIEAAKLLEASKLLEEQKHITTPTFSIIENDEVNPIDENIIVNIGTVIQDNDNISVTASEKPPGKKRGRKPKGGKIVPQAVSLGDKIANKPNIILHLKCSINDLSTNSDNLLQQDVDIFSNGNTKNELSYKILNDNNNSMNNCGTTQFTEINNDMTISASNTIIDNSDSHNIHNHNNHNHNHNHNNHNKNKSYNCDGDNDNKEIWKKLKELEYNLHMNNITDNKSACFWCSHDFDNPPIYIPKHYLRESYHVYGCFCTPECAAAHLMGENIDSSVKFERYHLLNHIYSKIYEYSKNIKPAPDPHYMLERYYGNLSIQEYRALTRSERLFLIVDKPLTRIMPELHEDNDDFIINSKIIPASTNYKVKRKVNKNSVQTKSNIMNENFGIVTN
jgi:hypothetical protein